jgi:tRNA (guanine-N7-)-methyltransferase
MGKNKLEHFMENVTFPHFFQPGFDELTEGFELKGKWNREFFENENPIIVEVGCGKGEYTVGLAEKYPDKNFIGMDKKGARMWRGAKTSLENDMLNVAFVRTKVELISYFFGKNEVDEIWITFPEPVLKERKFRKRFTSPRFLHTYGQFLKPDGMIHLKTDNHEFFTYTLDQIKEQNHKLHFSTFDLYNSEFEGDARNIQTYYEKKYLEQGMNINYLNFTLNKSKSH